MKQLALTLIILITFFANSGFGQVPNRIALELDARKNQRSYTPAQAHTIFKVIEPDDVLARTKEKVESYTLLEFLPVVSTQLKRSADPLITLEIPFEQELLILDLFRIDDDPIVIKTSDGGVFQDEGLHYRGILRGDVQSTAAISIYDNELVGVISSDAHGNVVLGKWPKKNTHVIYSDRDLTEKQDFNCEALERPDMVNEMQQSINGNSRSVAGKCTRIYFEVSHDLYVASDRDRIRVQNYVSGIFNQVATLYANEGVTVQISEIYIWTKSDPYKGNASDHLENFLTRRRSYNGDLAHLITAGRGNGGIAYVDVLCSRNFGYGYSDIGNDYAVFPSYSWTVNVIAHELGHNLGSPHTHACKWGPLRDKALDNCFSTEGGCKAGPSPNKGGTLMSYCHLRQQGINFKNGLGREPGDLIRERIAAASCLSSCGSGDTPVACPLAITKIDSEASACGQESGMVDITASGATNNTKYTIGSTTQTSSRFIGLAAGTYTVTVSNGSDCSVEQTVVVESGESTISIVSNVVESDCNVENGSVSLSVEGGQSPFQYTLGDKTQSQPEFVGLAPGSYVVQLVDANDCTGSTEVKVGVVAGPELASSIAHTSCNLSNGSIVLEASGGKAPYRFALGDDENDNGAFQELISGTYEASVTDAAGCTISTASIEVEASVAIEATIDVKHTSCGESNGHLDIDIVGGVGELTLEVNGSRRSLNDLANLASGNYQVRISDDVGCVFELEENIKPSVEIATVVDIVQPTCGQENGAVNIAASGGTGSLEIGLNDVFGDDKSFSQLAAGNYKVQIRDGAGCQKSEDIILEASSAPEISAALRHTTCGLANGNIEIEIRNGEGPYTTFLNGKPTSEFQHKDLPQGNYLIETTDALGCIVSSEHLIESSTAPQLQVDMLPADCGQQNGKIQVKGNGGIAPYQFNIGGAFDGNVSFTDLDTGVYIVALRDAGDCLASEEVEVTYDDRYRTPTLPPTLALCDGKAAILDADLDPETKINWYLNDKLLALTGSASIEVEEQGTYRAEVIYYEGCVLEASSQVTVHASPEEILPHQIELCEGASYKLNSSNIEFAYDWSHGQQGGEVLFEESGTYSLAITSTHGCMTNQQTNVNIIPKQIFANNELHKIQVCEGNSVVLSASGADEYRWYNEDQDVIAEGPSLEVQGNGNASYYLVGENSCFSDTARYSVELQADEAVITGDTAVIEGSVVTLRIDGASEQTWSTTFNQTCSDCDQSDIVPDMSGSVFVDYIDQHGCAGEQEIFIDVIPITDVIPQLVNVMTPNNDGANDRLIFDGIENFQQTALRVFDQNGNTIYLDESYENDWAGYFEDSVVPQGVYFYVVSFQLEDRIFEYDSALTIIKD